MELTRKTWNIIFVSALLFDSGLIIYAAIDKIIWLLYLMGIGGLLGAYELFNRWNVDERTDKAIDEASRLVIKIFLIIIISVGSVFIILGSFQTSILLEIGAVLIAAALILIYLQLIISLYYDGKLS